MRAALAEQNLFLPAPEQVLSLFAGQGGRALTVLPTQLLPGADYARLTDAVRQNFAGPARLLPPLLGEGNRPRGAGAAFGRPARRGRPDAVDGPRQRGGAGRRALRPDGGGRWTPSPRGGTWWPRPRGGARLADLLPRLTGRRVLLRPLLFAAGHHARVDLAGDGADSCAAASWRSGGYEVACNLTGLGEMEPVRALYRAQLRRALSER